MNIIKILKSTAHTGYPSVNFAFNLIFLSLKVLYYAVNIY